MDDFQRQMIMDAARTIGSGRNIQVNSRWFWSKYGNPFPDIRREIVQAAKSILETQDVLATGGVSGTIGDLYSQQGYPSDAGGGGPLEQSQATVYARFRYETTVDTPDGPQTEYKFKSYTRKCRGICLSIS